MAEKTEEQVYLGLFIAIPVALAINAILAYVGGRWMNKLSHKTSEDVLTAHYLGGRSFGTWITFGTLVSNSLHFHTLLKILCSRLLTLTPTLTFVTFVYLCHLNTYDSLRLASPVSPL